LVIGDFDRARTDARAALVQAHGVDLASWTAITIQHLAAVAASRGDIAAAAQLCGFCDELFRRDGVQRDLTEQRTYDLLRAALSAQLSKVELSRLTADGASLTEDQAVEMALAIG
jgi:hypothetical protein